MSNGKEFKVNKYLTLKLEKGELNKLETVIYIQGKRFKQCKFLLLNIPIDKISSLEDIESIDEAAEKLNHSNDVLSSAYIDIPPEAEFWAHSSNLQVWTEDNYNTNLIHSNLAFPLLKKLSEVGDIAARRVFKEEIVKRFSSGLPNVQKFLVLEGYMDLLTKEDMSIFVNSGIDAITKLEKTLNESVKLTIKKIPLSSRNPGFIVKDGEITWLRIVGYKLKKFPEPIRELTYLKELYLNNNTIDSVPEWIGELNSLRKLDLSNNKIMKLPESLGKLKSLKSLNLFKNYLEVLNDSIGSLSSLKILNVSKNNLSKIPKSFGNLTSLEELYADRNRLERIPKFMGNIHSLENLELGRNKIKKIPNSLGNLKFLINLDLNHNPLKKIPKSIIKIRTLNTLNLNKTNVNNTFEVKEFLGKKKKED